MLEMVGIILVVVLGGGLLLLVLTDKKVPAVDPGVNFTLDTNLSLDGGSKEAVKLSISQFGLRLMRTTWADMNLSWYQVSAVKFESRVVSEGALSGMPVVGLGVSAQDGREWLFIEEGIGADRRLKAAATMISGFAHIPVNAEPPQVIDEDED